MEGHPHDSETDVKAAHVFLRVWVKRVRREMARTQVWTETRWS
jgi:hypothetical protein